MNTRKRVLGIVLMLGILIPFISWTQLPVFREVSVPAGIEDVKNFTPQYGNGASTADFDGDGDIDFYLCTEKNIPDRLYQNDGRGYFHDVAAASGIEEKGSNRAALWFDYNGDRRLDLLVLGERCANRSCDNPVLISFYKQLEDHRFVEVSGEAGLKIGPAFDGLPYFAVGGAAAADLNQDGHLDLLITVWGGGVKLFLNNGDETFRDATEQAGLQMEEPTPWQPMLYDFNQDGLTDIYCNVDFAKNKLWINQGGSFVEQAGAYGLDNDFNEMGMAMSDFDNDGDLDIYITNITRDFQFVAQYNLLYKQESQNGKITFRQVANGQGVSQSGWDWGCTFIDIDNDGRQDLASTNGMDIPSWHSDASKLWLNSLAGFVDVSTQCGFDDELYATTLIAFDMERDGDMDLLQTLKFNPSNWRPAQLYENTLNESSGKRNFIAIKPRMEGANHFAIGSKLTLVAEDLVSARLISAGCSFYGQEPAEAHWGLGSRDSIHEVEVRWPDGKISIYQGLPVNKVHTLDFDHLEAPTNLSVSKVEGGATLSWEDRTDEEVAYYLYRASDPDFADYEVILLEKNSTTYTDSSLDESQDLFYRIRAFNGNVFSGNSNLLSIFGKNQAGDSRDLISVFPNPVSGNLMRLKNNSPYEGMMEVKVYDISGKKVLEENVSVLGFETVELSRFLVGGLYLLSIKMGEIEQVVKVSWQ